ncbi:hypothetical protein SARC_06341 [Sphaeroforma arctica JP610]|uniref:Prenylcysteine lyase domain-containing protein n=1 Tax=Sphaeroforma arctica JP610 TaxID=667725 RepID=A0A0L0FWW4_9EUKA|nr:hypothetical protein SARC_06341 [Sphaeroforma arctica JP610]KNC81322.1 hypothetical protein SARC_06341 [Sphaeroforma arctica JP610]|eukprot:XP_014155224.1 hypothetical protein SARC_06341 [Sphaeroforma arctica JP610]
MTCIDKVRLNTPVTTVRHCGVDSDSLCITTAAGEESMYDAVIIATPLENAHMDIPHDYSRSDEPADATSEDVHERPFRTTHTTLVAGTINPVYFGEDPGQSLPDDIFTTESVAHQVCRQAKLASPTGTAVCLCLH